MATSPRFSLGETVDSLVPRAADCSPGTIQSPPREANAVLAPAGRLLLSIPPKGPWEPPPNLRRTQPNQTRAGPGQEVRQSARRTKRSRQPWTTLKPRIE